MIRKQRVSLGGSCSFPFVSFFVGLFFLLFFLVYLGL